MSVFVDNPPTTTVLMVDSIRTDGGTQPRIIQDWKIIGEYAQDMLEGAVFPPVIVFFDGENYWLADGFHRYHATRQINRETINAEVKQGSQRDAILFSVGVNAHHGFRRTNNDKRAVVERLLRDEEWSKWGNREIARRCAVDEITVRRHRENLSATLSQISSERLAERNGTIYSMNSTNIGHYQPINEWSNLPSDYREDEEIEPRRNIDNIPISVPYISSKNNEWYTPQKYINAAKELMGGIDLDPASCEQANETVAAANYYHISKSGLECDWYGRVWLNPPYGYTDGESNQALWSNRLIDQFANRNITEAVLLVNAAVDTNWFQRLFDYPVCLTRGRINFSTPDPVASGSTHGSAFVYFGLQPDKFVEIFSEFGTVVRRW